MRCVTLLSDFGLQDTSAASARGILMQHLPDAHISDITHLVTPFNLQQAAYLLLAAYKHFPLGTCHLALVDVYYDRDPKFVLCKLNGHFFVAPDNGLLSIAFGHMENAYVCVRLTHPTHFSDCLHEIAKIIAKLKDEIPEDINFSKCDMQDAPLHCRPAMGTNTMECHVIHIDRYENVVINATRLQFESFGKDRPFSVRFMRNEHINLLSDHYHHVKPGNILCRFNSNNYLEIAINHGNAAGLLGLQLLPQKHLLYKTVKIIFE